MQLNRIIQFLLFAILIIGVFAAMARNAYGYTFMGLACFGLALLYLVQIAWKLIEDHFVLEKNEIIILIELLLLAAWLILFGLRAFYIYLPGGEIIFIMIGCFLFGVYSVIANEAFMMFKREGKPLARNLLSFYLSLLLFLVSMITWLLPTWSIVFGTLAMLALVPFIVSVVRQKHYEYAGKTVSIFQLVVAAKNKAGLLLLFFVTSAFYTGLATIGIIPVIENASKPRTYIELINNAETGKEKPVDGQYRHEAYKKSMDKFLERHGNN